MPDKRFFLSIILLIITARDRFLGRCPEYRPIDSSQPRHRATDDLQFRGLDPGA